METLVMITDIKTDVKEIKQDISEIKVTMAVNTASLEHHITRTNELQNLVAAFKDELIVIKEEVTKTELEFKTHLALINMIFKVVVALAGVVTFLQQTGLLAKLIALF